MLGEKVVVHAGREEILFCFRATGKTIPNLFDVQIAAGFLGSEYPASYGNLVQRYVGKQLGKEETRSDWRHRPLTPRQLDYAAQDVRDLPLIFDKLSKDLLAKGRLEWLKKRFGQAIGSGCIRTPRELVSHGRHAVADRAIARHRQANLVVA